VPHPGRGCDGFAGRNALGGYNCPIMLRRMAVLAVFAFMAIGVSGQPNKTAANNRSVSSQHPPTPDTTYTYDANCCTRQIAPKTNDESFQWHTSIKRPDWWLVLLGFGTLGAILWQTIQTKAAAKAALLNAQAVINAERAWMVARIEAEIIPDSEGVRLVRFTVRCLNNGRTPAFLLEMANHGVVLPREQVLPEDRFPWGKENVVVWSSEGVPLQPEEFLLRRNSSTIAPDLQRLIHGQDWLWVYGYIKYRDAFGNPHETRYCFLWDCVHGVEGIDKGSHFLTYGPPSYIRAT
jgi:hypothetical protein